MISSSPYENKANSYSSTPAAPKSTMEMLSNTPSRSAFLQSLQRSRERRESTEKPSHSSSSKPSFTPRRLSLSPTKAASANEVLKPSSNATPSMQSKLASHAFTLSRSSTSTEEDPFLASNSMGASRESFFGGQRTPLFKEPSFSVPDSSRRAPLPSELDINYNRSSQRPATQKYQIITDSFEKPRTSAADTPSYSYEKRISELSALESKLSNDNYKYTADAESSHSKKYNNDAYGSYQTNGSSQKYSSDSYGKNDLTQSAEKYSSGSYGKSELNESAPKMDSYGVSKRKDFQESAQKPYQSSFSFEKSTNDNIYVNKYVDSNKSNDKYVDSSKSYDKSVDSIKSNDSRYTDSNISNESKSVDSTSLKSEIKTIIQAEVTSALSSLRNDLQNLQVELIKQSLAQQATMRSLFETYLPMTGQLMDALTSAREENERLKLILSDSRKY